MTDYGLLYPVNLLVRGKTCLVVGGGVMAADKAAELLLCEAKVRLVAPDLSAQVQELAARPEHAANLELHQRAYRSGDLSGCLIAIAATGDPAANQQVFDDAQQAGILVNSADDPPRCDFFLPARVRQGDLLVAISSGGKSPAMASYLRRQIGQLLGAELGEMLELTVAVRAEIKAAGISTESLDWAAALDDGIIDLVRAGEIEQAKAQLKRGLLGG